MISIAQNASPEQVSATIIPSVMKLATGHWFTNRVSAIHIMSAIYDRVGTN